MDDTGKWDPLEQGISLSLKGYMELRHHFPEIKRAAKLASADDLPSGSWRKHLGNQVIASVTEEFPSLDIRSFYAPPTSANLSGNSVCLRPTRKGLYLSRVEMVGLDAILEHVVAEVPVEYMPQYSTGEGMGNTPCCLSHNGDQLCEFCAPFGDTPMSIGGKFLD